MRALLTRGRCETEFGAVEYDLDLACLFMTDSNVFLEIRDTNTDVVSETSFDLDTCAQTSRY